MEQQQDPEAIVTVVADEIGIPVYYIDAKNGMEFRYKLGHVSFRTLGNQTWREVYAKRSRSWVSRLVGEKCFASNAAARAALTNIAGTQFMEEVI